MKPLPRQEWRFERSEKGAKLLGPWSEWMSEATCIGCARQPDIATGRVQYRDAPAENEVFAEPYVAEPIELEPSGADDASDARPR